VARVLFDERSSDMEAFSAPSSRTSRTDGAVRILEYTATQRTNTVSQALDRHWPKEFTVKQAALQSARHLFHAAWPSWCLAPVDAKDVCSQRAVGRREATPAPAGMGMFINTCHCG